MDAAYKKAKTSNYISLKKLEYDDNSQDVILVNKTPLIAKVNNGSLKLINNERYVIKKVDKNTREIIIKNDRNEIKIIADEFQKLFRIGYAFPTHNALVIDGTASKIVFKKNFDKLLERLPS
jgi:hypothetical protein